MHDIIKFRQELHQHPELSGKEFTTQKRISSDTQALAS